METIGTFSCWTFVFFTPIIIWFAAVLHVFVLAISTLIRVKFKISIRYFNHLKLTYLMNSAVKEYCPVMTCYKAKKIKFCFKWYLKYKALRKRLYRPMILESQISLKSYAGSIQAPQRKTHPKKKKSFHFTSQTSLWTRFILYISTLNGPLIDNGHVIEVKIKLLLWRIFMFVKPILEAKNHTCGMINCWISFNGCQLWLVIQHNLPYKDIFRS